MSIWPLIFALVLVLAAAGLLLPALRAGRTRPLSRGASAAAVLRDKLSQLRRDREDGLIGPAEASATEAEIGRALLAASREADSDAAHAPLRRGSRAGLAAVALGALAVSVAIYLANGSTDLADRPFGTAEGAMSQPTMASEHEGARMDEAIASLRKRLEADPGNVDNWHLLARSYAAVGDYAKAADTYAQLIELAPLRVDLRGDYGEALVQAQQGFVGPAAVEAFEVVLAHAPSDPRALYYLALRDAQSGDSLRAAQGWARILREAPADASYRDAISKILEAIIIDAGLDRAALDIPDAPPAPPGPSAEDVKAATALPETEQLTMIRSMVERLESRLADEPGDIEGWLRLARSRTVLGEPDAARAALERALEANPGNAELRSALDGLR